MKKNLLTKILVTGSLFITVSAHSQFDARSDNNRSNNNTYAVTDSAKNGMKWTSLRTLDLQTGTYSNNILFPLLTPIEVQAPQGSPEVISFNAVAAIAHDRDNKKLFYTPILTDKLYYIDLKTMKRYLVTNHFTGLMPKASDQSNVITRMVIGDDDKGYALTNDGRHFIRFRTNNNNPSVVDLGSLADAPGNNEMSVHNLCSSYGGDLIADDDGHLYLFTSRNHVFKIDIRTKIARYMGTVSNLPTSFTTSGAAVDKAEEKVILVSSVDSTDVYSVNLKTLAARGLHAKRPWLAADLANGFVLETRKHYDHYEHHNDRNVLNDNEAVDIDNNTDIQLYPNPVTAKTFNINFASAKAATYTIRVMDVEGKSITSKIVTVGGKGNIVAVNLPAIISSGIYIVRVTDSNNKAWYSGKIFVQ